MDLYLPPYEHLKRDLHFWFGDKVIVMSDTYVNVLTLMIGSKSLTLNFIDGQVSGT